MADPHLITVDELRAAGALDVPPGWRKSLSVERDLFSGLLADDDELAEEQPSNAGNPDNDESGDESAWPEDTITEETTGRTSIV